MPDKRPATQRILVVDDSQEDRTRIKNALLHGAPHREYLFYEAGSSDEAIEICSARTDANIDCVVIDIHMPGMDGIAFLNEIQEDHVVRFPVIVLTSGSEDCHASAALRAGAQDYITKDSIYPSVLFRVIDNAIERHSMVRRLKESERAADAANRAKSALIGNISHEIRTPMTAVLGLCELLLDGDLTADQRNLLKMVRDNGSYLVEIVNDLLDLSKMEANMLRLEVGTIKLRPFIEELLGFLKIRAKENRTILSSHVAEELPNGIAGDPIRIRQILLNLLGNAIKFTPNGKVLIAVTQCVYNETPHLCFSIQDTGCGISEEDLETIFQPFVQVGNKRRQVIGGTGLGLAICRRLAQAMNGFISVESKLSEGSTFEVTIPLVESQDFAANLDDTGLTRRVEEILDGCGVLVAEDTRATQILMQRIIEAAGGIVTIVENGQQLIETVRTNGENFAVVVTDVQMPVVDGLEATTQIRKFNTQIPIVILTADALGETREEAMKCGANQVVTKPIRREKFLETIAHFCEQAHCSDSTCDSQPALD